jgi:thiamine-monophosphate kinase
VDLEAEEALEEEVSVVEVPEGKNGFFPIELPWTVHPERDQEWFNTQRAEIITATGERGVGMELLCVSGDLGGAYIGLQLLEREKQIFLENPNIQPDLEGKDYVIERQLKPEARKDIVDYLRENGIKPTSMIDISDGLASEIKHICKQSNVGCQVYEEKIPIDQMTYDTAREFGLDPTTCALNGGEDYELLFTIKQSDYEKIKNSPDITIIGHITDAASGCQLVSKSNNIHELKAQGWKAF